MAFFSGYPPVYTVIVFIVGQPRLKNKFLRKIGALLPLGYALVGTMYLGFELRKLYPDYSYENIKQTCQLPLLTVWALLSMLFWIPAISKRRIFSLIHSIVFLFFLVRDLFFTINPTISR